MAFDIHLQQVNQGAEVLSVYTTVVGEPAGEIPAGYNEVEAALDAALNAEEAEKIVREPCQAERGTGLCRLEGLGRCQHCSLHKGDSRHREGHGRQLLVDLRSAGFVQLGS